MGIREHAVIIELHAVIVQGYPLKKKKKSLKRTYTSAQPLPNQMFKNEYTVVPANIVTIYQPEHWWIQINMF